MELSVSAHGRRIVELLDALRVDRACLVGHGVGGAVATWVALHARDRVSRLGVIQSATTTGWFSRNHSIGRALRSALLRGPVWCWMPLAQLAIARTYDDWSQGYRSAAMYLLPFTSPGGSAVLRRHLEHLTNGDIAAVGVASLDPALPYLAVTSKDSNFSPEEHPSEIAASVARLLQS
jgi:pimeloyl-ACP methyl ester carboxylesterase